MSRAMSCSFVTSPLNAVAFKVATIFSGSTPYRSANLRTRLRFCGSRTATFWLLLISLSEGIRRERHELDSRRVRRPFVACEAFRIRVQVLPVVPASKLYRFVVEHYGRGGVRPRHFDAHEYEAENPESRRELVSVREVRRLTMVAHARDLPAELPRRGVAVRLYVQEDDSRSARLVNPIRPALAQNACLRIVPERGHFRPSLAQGSGHVGEG